MLYAVFMKTIMQYCCFIQTIYLCYNYEKDWDFFNSIRAI